VVFENYDGPDGLVVAVVDLPEVDERSSRSTGFAKPLVVAVVRVHAAIRVGEEAVIGYVVQAVGAVESSRD